MKIQAEDEVAINLKIENLLATVSQLIMQRDQERVHEIATEMKKTWKALHETQEEGILLNSRQKLFRMPIKRYAKLAFLIKDFEPHLILWSTASGKLIYCYFSDYSFVLQYVKFRKSQIG